MNNKKEIAAWWMATIYFFISVIFIPVIINYILIASLISMFGYLGLSNIPLIFLQILTFPLGVFIGINISKQYLKRKYNITDYQYRTVIKISMIYFIVVSFAVLFYNKLSVLEVIINSGIGGIIFYYFSKRELNNIENITGLFSIFKSKLFWTIGILTIIIVLLMISGFISYTPEEENPILKPFVNETLNVVGDRVYHRTEFTIKDKPFTLTTFNGAEVNLGRRLVYSIDKGSESTFPAFRVHVEQSASGEYEAFKDKYVNVVNFTRTEEPNIIDPNYQDFTYKNHKVYLSIYDYQANKEIFSNPVEPVGMAIILFPEQNIVVTIYFPNTTLFDIDLPNFEKVIKTIIDNVESEYIN